MAKGKRLPIPKTTSSRSTRPLQRVFVDLSGPRPVQSIGGAQYIMIVKDDYSHYSCTFFLTKKSEAADAFKIFLADLRDQCIPSTVESVRSDGGGEFSGGAFAQLYRDRGIRQEFTLPDAPKLNGVAERRLHLIQEAAQAACLEAPRLFPEAQIPSTGRLWAEACFWATEVLNKSSSTANPGKRTPHELFYGVVPKLRMLPFLRRGYCRVRFDNKAKPKAEKCFYLSGALVVRRTR